MSSHLILSMGLGSRIILGQNVTQEVHSNSSVCNIPRRSILVESDDVGWGAGDDMVILCAVSNNVLFWRDGGGSCRAPAS